MKSTIKRILAKAGLVLQRLPANEPTGHFLARDLPLVVGRRPGVVCIDAGAHNGLFVDLLLECLNAPTVHAFEPVPDAFSRLSQRHGANSRVRLVAAGLGEVCGEMQIRTFDNSTLNSFLPVAPSAQHPFGKLAPSAIVHVPVVTLDTYAVQQGLTQIDLLKIDTQGFEMHVLRGAARLLRERRVHAALVELNFVALYDGQAWAHEVITHLHAHDLHLVDIYEKCRLNPLLGWCTALFVRR